MSRKIQLILYAILLFLACTDEIDKSNRFTFTGETMADYLLNRSDRYSHMITLFKRADLFSLLNTYGRFTLFLPDNTAVEKYLAEQDSIYWATKDTPNFINTGISSPLVEELSDSMANVIARTHIVESDISMADMGEGALSTRNFNYRFLGVNYVVKGEQYYIMLNNSAAIISGDNDVENGVVHHVDKVVAPSQKNVPELIGSCQFFKIFAAALNRTGFADSLTMDSDDSYDPDLYSLRSMFGEKLSPPKTRYYKFTSFIEPDDVFRSNGIENIDDLTAFAEKWYGTEERDNPKSPKNALYKFVAYHFVPRELPHNKIVPYDITMKYDFEFEDVMGAIHDRYDYFETMLGTLMKVVKPLSRPEGRDTYINFNKRELPYNIELRHHLNVRVIPLTEFITMKEEYALFNQMAVNGIVHPIDKILIYNENEMYGNILNERLRIDMHSLVPELSCNALRYNFEDFVNYAIPPGYSEKVKINTGNIKLAGNGAAYNCDEFILEDMFDVEFTLPPLPPRVYEVRVGTDNSGWSSGSVVNLSVQMYMDGKVEGRPSNININDPQPGMQTGFVADEYTYDNGMENDKNMRLKGWMKGPKSIHYGDTKTARDVPYFVRKIITRKYFDAGRHTIRFRYVGPMSLNARMRVDYLEFVPLHIISDPTKPEDRY